MTPSPQTPFRLLLGLMIMTAAAPLATATDSTWTFAGTGSWDTPGNWSAGVANGTNATATFSYGLPNTDNSIISVDTARTIGNLTFTGTAGAGTHNITLNGPQALTLSTGTATAPTITTNMASRTVTINTTLAGTEGLNIVSTTGALVIGGTNTYTGLTQLSGGPVVVNNNKAFGSTTGDTAFLDTNVAIELKNGITITGETLHARGNGTGSNLGVLNTAGSAEWAGNIVLDSSVRFGANGAAAVLTLGGVIADSDTTARSVSFSYGTNSDVNGTVVLSGANTYGGSTTVFRGTLKLAGGNNRMPTGTTLSIGGTAVAATVDLNGVNQTVAGFNSGGSTGARTLTNTSGTTSTFTVNQASGSATFDGLVSGAINFVKQGNGILALTGTANTFTGNITIEGGTLGIASAFINDTADVSLLSGAVFNLNFIGTDTIGGLYFNNVAQAIGTYGSIGSTATYQSTFFTGTGILNVTTAAIPEPSSAAAIAGLLVAGACTLRRRRG